LKYKIPGLASFISLALWLPQQWLTQFIGANYANFPWKWLFFISLFFLIGVIYSDLFNEHSNLKKWIKSKQRIFEVDHFVLASKVEGSESFYSANCCLNFLSRIKNVDVSFQITQYASTDHAVNKFVLFQDNFDLVEENLKKKYSVATFPRRVSNDVAVGYPYWGADKKHSWAGDGSHIVTIKAHSFLRSQTESFLITAIRNVGGGPEPVLVLGGEETSEFLTISDVANA